MCRDGDTLVLQVCSQTSVFMVRAWSTLRVIDDIAHRYGEQGEQHPDMLVDVRLDERVCLLGGLHWNKYGKTSIIRALMENWSKYQGGLIIKFKYTVKLDNSYVNMWSQEQGGLNIQMVFK